MKFDFSVLKKNKLTESRERKVCFIVNVCLILMMYAAFTFLFYRQAVEYNGKYWSDLPVHIETSKVGGDYSFLYFVMGIICRLPYSTIAIVLFESSIVVLTFLLSKKMIRTHFEIGGRWATWIAAGILFLCSIYIPVLCPSYYNHTLITQPWHNITYFGMRLFSIPVFIYTLDILGRYRSCFTKKDWLSIAIPLMLSAAIKPNFLIDYSLTLLCVLIIDFVRDIVRKELCASSFFRYVLLGSTVFPAVIVLLYQALILYVLGPSSKDGITIVFLTSRFFSSGMTVTVFKIIRDIAFPLLVAAYGYKYFTRKEKFVWLLFLITLVQVIILEETGPRASHGNFEWGIYNVGYLMFLYMVPLFIQLLKKTPWKQKDVKDKCFTLAGSSLLCAHLFCGLKYYLILLSGSGYGI